MGPKATAFYRHIIGLLYWWIVSILCGLFAVLLLAIGLTVGPLSLSDQAIKRVILIAMVSGPGINLIRMIYFRAEDSDAQ